MFLALVLACSNPWEEKPAWVDEGDSDADTATDTGDAGDTGESGTDTAVDTGPHGLAASDAVGDCLDEAALAGASRRMLVPLWEGDIPGTGWDAVPATNVIADDTAWAAFQAEAGLTLGAVDFTAERVVVLTDWRTSTCDLRLFSLEAWDMPDGLTTYVEGMMITEGSAPCAAVCDDEGSRMVVVRVSRPGATACRRTQTWCD